MIHYADAALPEAGSSNLVAPGVRWLRMPLPFALNHINVWLVDDDGGSCIVDTGITGKTTQTLWQQVLADAGTQPTRVVATHMHPDHCGSAGWLCAEYSVDLHMSRSEYLMCRVLCNDEPPPPPAALDFYRAAGLSEEQVAHYAELYGRFGRAVAPLPDAYHRLYDGVQLQLGTTTWHIVCGYGHSPEHACLYNERDNVFIAGDQLLPTISSNVSVWPTEPLANPLKEWLDSCRRLQELLPADVLVLPAHGKPFRGARARLGHLIDEHHESLDKLLVQCREPQLAVDVFASLFRARISDANRIMATGEAIAHLNYLIAENRMRVSTDAKGRHWYQSA